MPIFPNIRMCMEEGVVERNYGDMGQKGNRLFT